MRGPRTLRSRLFSWFVGAILLAAFTAACVAAWTRPEAGVGVQLSAHHIAERLASRWEDPVATQQFVDEVHDVIGFDVQLARDVRRAGARLRRAAERGDGFFVDGSSTAQIPVVRSGALVGVVTIEGYGPASVAWGWSRAAVVLALIVLLLSAMAGKVANQLARPLERLAGAADRFGSGDLSFRTDVAGGGQRWVAREVRDVAVRFNRMADRVEATVRGQRELLGAISHELRSPLGRARVALEIARDRLPRRADVPDRFIAGALDDVESQLGAVESILRGLLDVTRAGLADLRMDRSDLSEWLVARVVEHPTPPRIECVISPAARHVFITFDATLLERALHNLLVNARAHGHPLDQPIEVHLDRSGPHPGESLRITVRDRGPGFALGFEERAFEPFVRGDASRARPSVGDGFGLGLAIVRRVVEAHGGSVFAGNAVGGGAQVGFELPIRPEAR
ncbi:MAG: ATP-binding protein [Polyangiaceae bacterium]|jgi:signal transduction histidine kinase